MVSWIPRKEESRPRARKNGDTTRLSRHTRRPTDFSTLRANPLSLPLPFLCSPLPNTPSPPWLSLWHGHKQMGPSILRSHCYSKYPAPLRPRERARYVTMPGHSWHCYRYCYYYRYCCRLRPSGEWESRGPMSQLLRRVLH